MRLIKSPIRVYIVIWQEINFIFSILFYFLYLTIIIIFFRPKMPAFIDKFRVGLFIYFLNGETVNKPKSTTRIFWLPTRSLKYLFCR